MLSTKPWVMEKGRVRDSSKWTKGRIEGNWKLKIFLITWNELRFDWYNTVLIINLNLWFKLNFLKKKKILQFLLKVSFILFRNFSFKFDVNLKARFVKTNQISTQLLELTEKRSSENFPPLHHHEMETILWKFRQLRENCDTGESFWKWGVNGYWWMTIALEIMSCVVLIMILT